MTKLLTGLTVGAAMLVGVSAAQAEPLKLTGQQMDAVTAGSFFKGFSFADASGKALAFGRVSIATTHTSAFAAPGRAAATSSSTACSGALCLF